MPQRTAPPFSCYLWHFFCESEPFCDKTGSVVVCRRNKKAYRLVKSCNVVWLYAIICGIGITASALLASSRGYDTLAFAVALLLSFILCPLYSYRHSEFEELPDEATRDG